MRHRNSRTTAQQALAGAAKEVAASSSSPGRACSAAVILAVAGGLLISACSGPPSAPRPPGNPHVGSPALPVGATLLATMKGTAARYASPDGPTAGRVPGTWYGVS